MRNKLITIFTNLTFIFAILSFLELLLGICTEKYLDDYKGSFFDIQLPYVFIVTIIISILFNLAIVAIEYFNDESI